MTQTSTDADAPIRYLCEVAPAQATKLEAEPAWRVEGTEEIEYLIKTRNAICYSCEDDSFDGTEVYPGTLPLSRLFA